MKKIFILTIGLIASLSLYAESSINMTPLKLTVDQAKAGCTGTLYVNMVNDEKPGTVVGVQFNLYLPTGMTATDVAKYGRAASAFNGILSGTMKDASNYYKVIGSGTNVISGTTGEILAITYSITSDLAEGVYPIRCSTTKYTDKDANTITAPNSYSYIIVGNGGELAYPNAYALPSFVMESMNKEEGITSLDLSKVTAVNGTFAYVDGRKVVAPTAGVTVAKATYSRTVESGYASMVIPFDATLAEETNCYDTDATPKNGYVHFDAATELKAGEAYALKAPVTIEASAENFTLVGQTSSTVEEGKYFMTANGLFKATATTTLKPNRASWDFGSAGIKGFTFDDATGISTVELDENGSIYDLNGRKLNKAGRGVNIINGQKILKK